MNKYTYEYKQFLSNLPGFRSKGGGVYLLKRNDGKSVKVHRKRFNQLVEENRLTYKKTETETDQALKEYSNFMDQVIES